MSAAGTGGCSSCGEVRELADGRCSMRWQAEADRLGPAVAEIEERNEAELREEAFALPIAAFVAAKGDAPAPLLGTRDDCILPALGLGLLIARGGKGKTTWLIDLILHLAAGRDYLGLAVERPLDVLLIENEGPREPFRRKLERRVQSFEHELRGGIHVYTENWGHARLDLAEFVDRLNSYCDEHTIDLVVGDPLDSLGMDGEGSPSETREMVDRLKAAGLFTRRAWILPHHSRKESVTDSVDEASGAWGGRPDAMLGLEKRPNNQARLSFPKVRWQALERRPYLLDFDPETEGFTFVKEEEGEERDYGLEIEELLDAGGWLTAKEIAAPVEGIGAAVDRVREVLEADPRFVSRSGSEAKEVGRHPNATVWQKVTSPQKSHESHTGPRETLTAGLTSDFPYKEVRSPSQVSQRVREVTPNPESPPNGHPDDDELDRLIEIAENAEREATQLGLAPDDEGGQR